MTVSGLRLTAGLAALATMGLVACGDDTEMAGDDPLHDAQIARNGEDRMSPTDPAATPTPADPLPNAPPELVAPGTGAAPPQGSLDPTDPTAPPPTNPPPVLPSSPPN